jgi:hypothetical protein
LLPPLIFSSGPPTLCHGLQAFVLLPQFDLSMFLYKLYQIHHIQLIFVEWYDLINLFGFDENAFLYFPYLAIGINKK